MHKSANSRIGLQETLKKNLSDLWAEINNRVAGRDKQICAAMQELGSYSDAYSALHAWLQDTEESLANQRPPSIEHKVVKEQTRANDILLKHIEEKQQRCVNKKFVKVNSHNLHFMCIRHNVMEAYLPLQKQSMH